VERSCNLVPAEVLVLPLPPQNRLRILIMRGH
jgi:hypothetical protein